MKPIIFKGEMVRAILDGRKTQTRRVIKCNGFNDFADGIRRPVKCRNGENYIVACPYGKVGDKLWVRETWADCKDMGIVDSDGNPTEIIYKAEEPWAEEWDGKWKPSIYMPHKYSRITLEITNIRVERVQDITELECEIEGTPNYNKTPSGVSKSDFEFLWNSINEKRGYSWKSNPYVWVIEFKRGFPA